MLAHFITQFESFFYLWILFCVRDFEKKEKKYTCTSIKNEKFAFIWKLGMQKSFFINKVGRDENRRIKVNHYYFLKPSFLSKTLLRWELNSYFFPIKIRILLRL